jgi:hypothetical protein
MVQGREVGVVPWPGPVTAERNGEDSGRQDQADDPEHAPSFFHLSEFSCFGNERRLGGEFKL